jgi:D-alanyl-D-alanine carboxypeptidase
MNNTDRGFVPARAVALAVAAGIVLAPLGLTAGTAGANVPSSTVPSSASVEPAAALDRALQHLVDSGATAVVAVLDSTVVDDGDDRAARVLGAARLDPYRAAQASDATRVGSITKTFVSTAVLQLVAAGRIGLDEPIGRRLPGVVPNGKAITVRMLLQHTSGLFNYTEDEAFLPDVIAHPYRAVTPRQVLAVAFAHPPNFAPGAAWSYSNTNYVVLGLLLEKVTGQPVQTVLDRQIIAPLGLRNTYLALDGRWRGPHLHGYAPPGLVGNPDYVDLSRWNPSWGGAAGAMVSNPTDLARFYRALMSGRLLPTAQLRQLTATVGTGIPGLRYGLGLFSLDTACGRVWGHDGGIPGYLTQAFTDRTGTRSAVLELPTEPDGAIAAGYDAAIEALACQMLDPSGRGGRAQRLAHGRSASGVGWDQAVASQALISAGR